MHYFDDRYYIRSIGLRSRNLKRDVLEASELTVDTFYGDTMFNFWFSRVYNIREEALEHIYQSERDPNKRLAKYVTQAKLRQSLIYSRADAFYGETLINGSYSYGVYDSKHPGGPRLVAYTTLRYPKNYPALPDVSTWNKIKLWYLKIEKKVKDFFRFFGLEHPFNNKRKKELFDKFHDAYDLPKNTPESIDKLAQATDEEIKSLAYPPEYMWYVGIVVVSEYYQRQKLGNRMLAYALNQIDRSIVPEFVSQDGKHRQKGEVRALLDSTEKGRGMYEKLGFKLAAPSTTVFHADGFEIRSNPMVVNLSREQPYLT